MIPIQGTDAVGKIPSIVEFLQICSHSIGLDVVFTYFGDNALCMVFDVDFTIPLAVDSPILKQKRSERKLSPVARKRKVIAKLSPGKNNVKLLH
jgi:hypothetical protein